MDSFLGSDKHPLVISGCTSELQRIKQKLMCMIQEKGVSFWSGVQEGLGWLGMVSYTRAGKQRAPN